MGRNVITVKKLRRNIDSTKFLAAYKKIMISENAQSLSRDEISSLLKIAVLFINYGDEHLEKMGYRIILRYSNLFNDYIPLHDVAVFNDFIPVAKFIENKHFDKNELESSFSDLFLLSYKENFKGKNVYFSAGQKEIIDFAESTKGNIAIIAPTSYGKTDIIISQIMKNVSKKVCVIVQTKALLSQTRKRIMESSEGANKINRIIIHPDMYKGNEKSFIAVLTQERLLRLLQKDKRLSFDLILVDEAHNLLYKNSRAILLAQVLMILRKRSKLVDFQFFTPFLIDINSLRIPYIEYKLHGKKIDEHIKVEKYYSYDIRSGSTLHLYDQFIDKFIKVDSPKFKKDVEVVMHNRAAKNIVYLNKTRNLEKVALDLSSRTQKTDIINESVEILCKAMSEYLHEDYNLLKCIKGGVVYHHGSMPDIIRLYAEHIFTEMKEFQFIVTSSTLLEGVNIPAEKIFVLDSRTGRGNLTSSQFRNLAGRVCRFKDIFKDDTGSMAMLEPSVYIIDGEFTRRGANIKEFLRKRVKDDVRVRDKIDNLLLLDKEKNKNISKDKRLEISKTLECLENIEPNTVKIDETKYANSEIGKACFKNNITEFDIIEKESQLLSLLGQLDCSNKINDVNNLISAIVTLFISLIDQHPGSNNLLRLKNKSAQNFYSMLLSWRMDGSPYKMMITKFVKYWSESTERLVFVGQKWGEVKRTIEDRLPLYVSINDKTNSQKINLAIVRIKEEQDFIDNELIKYIEVLNDLNLLEKAFYERIKYGSADPNMICLLKNGFSIDLARRVTAEKYKKYVTIDLINEDVIIDPKIIKEMEENKENKLIIFEIGYHLN